jgi:uncharacterized repeat protein (TIGR03803 family)
MGASGSRLFLPRRLISRLKQMRTFLLALIFATSGFIASAQTLQTLCSFNGTNGANPYAGLTLGNDGNFYGTTYSGGSSNRGTVFQVTTNGALTVLVSFNGTNGANPYAGLTLGNDGNFYGTTYYGTTWEGGSGYGTVFKVTTNGTLTTLVSFNGTDGSYPFAGLTLGTDGNFYGTTSQGGWGISYGTVFRVTTNGTLTTLVSFNNGTYGGEAPGALTLGDDGNLYGTTEDSVRGNGYGTVFQVTTNGTLTALVYFDGADGLFPEAPLTPGNDGNFYGTTSQGGNMNLNNGFGFGTIFQVTTNGTLTTLVSFNGTNGAGPDALTLGNNGNFYGTTHSGGVSNSGTFFRLSFSPVVPPTLPTLTLQLWLGYPLLTLYGILGDTYTIQYTTNLADQNWTPMLIVPNLSISPFQMIDPAGIGQTARFYRALQQ